MAAANMEEECDQIIMQYICPCGNQIEGVVATDTTIGLSYMQCSRCDYPCPDCETQFSFCPLCEEVDVQAKVVCLIDSPTLTFTCEKCRGKVPVELVATYWNTLFTRAIEETKLEDIDVEIEKAPEQTEGFANCLYRHKVTCLLIDGQMVALCSECNKVIELENVEEALLAVAVQSLRFCECSQGLERYIVLEDQEKQNLLIKCHRCGFSTRAPNTPPFRGLFSRDQWGVSTGRMTVKNIEDLQVGDHIVFKRKLYEHHAIVAMVDPSCETFSSIHYGEGDKALSARRAYVQEATTALREVTDPLMVVLYPPLDCLPFHLVVQRAMSKMGESRYNLITSNCEHLARWCKVGDKSSTQVDRAITKVSSVAREVARSGAVNLAIRKMPRSLGRAAGSMVGGLKLALDVVSARRAVKEGRLTRSEYRRQLVRNLVASGVAAAVSLSGAGLGTSLAVGMVTGLLSSSRDNGEVPRPQLALTENPEKKYAVSE